MTEIQGSIYSIEHRKERKTELHLETHSLKIIIQNTLKICKNGTRAKSFMTKTVFTLSMIKMTSKRVIFGVISESLAK